MAAVEVVGQDQGGPGVLWRCWLASIAMVAGQLDCDGWTVGLELQEEEEASVQAGRRRSIH